MDHFTNMIYLFFPFIILLLFFWFFDLLRIIKKFKEKKTMNKSNNLPNLIPVKYIDTPKHKATIEYGRYLVVRKDGKKHLETFNGTGWAYNHNSIVAYYLPKID